MADTDQGTKLYARQYTSRKGTTYYWGRYGGFEVRIFRGKEHEGKPSLDVWIKQVEEEAAPRQEAPPPADAQDEIPF